MNQQNTTKLITMTPEEKEKWEKAAALFKSPDGRPLSLTVFIRMAVNAMTDEALANENP